MQGVVDLAEVVVVRATAEAHAGKRLHVDAGREEGGAGVRGVLLAIEGLVEGCAHGLPQDGLGHARDLGHHGG